MLLNEMQRLSWPPAICKENGSSHAARMRTRASEVQLR
jgi:hypothetical protein